MSNIQKANAFPTWWVGTSPKYGIECRIKVAAGYTDEECKARLKKKLKKADDDEYERIKSKKRWKKWINSEEYALEQIELARIRIEKENRDNQRIVQKYKQKAIDQLKKEIQRRQNENNMRFGGYYTQPAIMDHKSELDRIKLYEEQQMAQIEKDFDGSSECLKRLRPIAQKDDDEYEDHLRLMQNLYGGRQGHYVGR